MDETKIEQLEREVAQSLDGMTVEEIADVSLRAFCAVAAVARKLARENAELRKKAA